MLSNSLINLGIVVSGAIAVFVTAFFIFRPGPNKKPRQARQTAPVIPEAGENYQPAAGEEPGEEVKKNKEDSPIWRTRRFIIKRMRELRGRIPRTEHKPGEEEQSFKDTATAAQPPDNIQPEFQRVKLPSIEYPADTIVTPVTAAETHAQIPDTNAADGEEITEEIPKSLLNTDTSETTDEEIQEEIEQLIMETGQEGAPDSDNAEEPKDGNVFDLFKDEMVEESAASKFAANLNPVDINDLLSEVNDLKNHLR